jgi:dTDP-4-dehydrorhamnose reductase
VPRQDGWTILLLGGTGQLGFELARALAPLGHVVDGGTPSRAGQGGRLDVADASAVDTLVDAVGPHVIVNASAYTAVDAAEDDPDAAHAVNRDGPAHLAQAARRRGAFLVHFSTDYVFDGAASRPYVETDRAEPLNVYGRSKLAGERAIADAGAGHLVLRTSWLFSARGRNFPTTILDHATRGEPLRVVDDQHGNPTSARLLAALTAQVLAQARSLGLDWLAERGGLYHAASQGSCSWYELAREVLRAGSLDVAMIDLQRVGTTEFGARAVRPQRSVLACSKLRDTFGLALPGWREHLALVLEERPRERATSA